MVTRREFLIAGGALLAAGCTGKSETPLDASTTAESAAQLHIKDAAAFKILQFTDLHFFSPRERRVEAGQIPTLKIMDTLIEQTGPDLVMITGDVWPGNRGGDFASFMMRRAVRRLGHIGMPWAFTWGNHDMLADMNAGHKTLTGAPDSLYRGAATGGNYTIGVIDGAGERAAELLCLNTTDIGMAQEQRDWLAALPPAGVPRLAFFHIPLKQYADIWENGVAEGIIGEDPCAEEEDGASLACLKNAGVRACICGHDHVNDYEGVIDGVELVYGRATGLGGYGREYVPKGGKLITLDCTQGTYTMCSVLPDGTSWTPKPGERIDHRRARQEASATS